MIKLLDNFFAIDKNELKDNIKSIDFNINTDISKLDKDNALNIDFKNDNEYATDILKKLNRSNVLNYYCNADNNKIIFVISNYNEDIIECLKALVIEDKYEKYNYIYDTIFKKLDDIWSSNNPCDFCNNMCVASRNNQNSHKEDGCCYSFEYSKNPFSLHIIKNVKRCKYLGEDKHCMTKNISCKLYTCKYLKKNKNFNINIDDFIIANVFFSNKERLVLRYNFFRTKEEILNKLMENSKIPYPIYWYHSKYRIS